MKILERTKFGSTYDLNKNDNFLYKIERIVTSPCIPQFVGTFKQRFIQIFQF